MHPEAAVRSRPGLEGAAAGGHPLGQPGHPDLGRGVRLTSVGSSCVGWALVLTPHKTRMFPAPLSGGRSLNGDLVVFRSPWLGLPGGVGGESGAGLKIG